MSTDASNAAHLNGNLHGTGSLKREEQFAFEILGRRRDDLAMRSSVRRALRQETESYAIPYLAPVLVELPPNQRVGVARVYGMMTSFLNLDHESSSKGADGKWVNRRFGHQLAIVFRESVTTATKSAGVTDPVGVRLSTLPMLDVEQAAEVISGLLDRLDRKGPRQIDWLDVLHLLQFWQPNSDDSKRPVFDYYSYDA